MVTTRRGTATNPEDLPPLRRSPRIRAVAASRLLTPTTPPASPTPTPSRRARKPGRPTGRGRGQASGVAAASRRARSPSDADLDNNWGDNDEQETGHRRGRATATKPRDKRLTCVKRSELKPAASESTGEASATGHPTQSTGVPGTSIGQATPSRSFSLQMNHPPRGLVQDETPSGGLFDAAEDQDTSLVQAAEQNNGMQSPSLLRQRRRPAPGSVRSRPQATFIALSSSPSTQTIIPLSSDPRDWHDLTQAQAASITQQVTAQRARNEQFLLRQRDSASRSTGLPPPFTRTIRISSTGEVTDITRLVPVVAPYTELPPESMFPDLSTPRRPQTGVSTTAATTGGFEEMSPAELARYGERVMSDIRRGDVSGGHGSEGGVGWCWAWGADDGEHDGDGDGRQRRGSTLCSTLLITVLLLALVLATWVLCVNLFEQMLLGRVGM